MRVYTTILCLFIAYFLPCLLAETCQFKGEDQSKLSEAKRRLQVIENQIKRVSIKEETKGYGYTVGVCTLADETLTDPKFIHASVTQDRKDDEKTITTVIGRMNSSMVVAGKDWVLLEYFDGEPYGHHCQQEPRSAKIMFTCAPGVLQPRTSVMEDNNRTEGCYYLFEIETDAACPPPAEESHKLSPGSVVCIIFLVLVGVYLIGGALYQRIIVGAKGMEQIPHYAFWQDFGNLQADGCDLLCRSGSRTRGSREYRGIGDDQIHPPQDVEVTHDDSLLPM